MARNPVGIRKSTSVNIPTILSSERATNSVIAGEATISSGPAEAAAAAVEEISAVSEPTFDQFGRNTVYT